MAGYRKITDFEGKGLERKPVRWMTPPRILGSSAPVCREVWRLNVGRQFHRCRLEAACGTPDAPWIE